MKPTENYEQLLERFTKRIAQLSAKADELYGPYAEYVQICKDLDRLEGSIIKSSAFCSSDDKIVSDNYKIVKKQNFSIIPPIGGG